MTAGVSRPSRPIRRIWCPCRVPSQPKRPPLLFRRRTTSRRPGGSARADRDLGWPLTGLRNIGASKSAPATLRTCEDRAGGGSRTHDLTITSRLRYHCATPASLEVSRIGQATVARWCSMHRRFPARALIRVRRPLAGPGSPGDGQSLVRAARLAGIARTTPTVAARPQAGPRDWSLPLLPLSQCRSNTRRSASP